MDGTQATTRRALDASSVLRERKAEILDAWEREEVSLDPSARGAVRAFLERCMDAAAEACAGERGHVEALPEEAHLAAAARGLLTVRGPCLRGLEQGERSLARAQPAVADVLDRAMRAVIDRLEAHSGRAARHARFVAEASALLASSLDYRTTLSHVAKMVVPELCDFCAVDAFESDGVVRDHVAVAHRDPRMAEFMREGRRRYGASERLLEIAREGRTHVLLDIDHSVLAGAARDHAHLAMMEELNPRSVLCIPLVASGCALGVMTLGQSESGRRFWERDVALAEELGRLASNAIANARLHCRATESIELRERVLAVVSHDLRSPLAAIDLAGAVLLELPATRGDPFVQKQLAMVRRNVARMSRLIGDLLDMSSIQAGRLELERQPCELGALLAETLEAHQSVARDKTVELRADLAGLDERVTPCDRDRLHQVLSNLLGNAIKFCDAGAAVTLSAEVRGTEAWVAVDDTGPGIAEPDLPHVFELFWKGKGHRGTGLGLFIARGIIEAHGGRIGVESQVDRGSTFWFTLPLGGCESDAAGS